MEESLKDLKGYTFPSLTLGTNKGGTQAFNIVADLINPLSDLTLETHEAYCREALEAFSSQNLTNANATKYQTKAKRPKKIEKKSASTDLFAKLNSYTVNQLKNHALRFGLDTDSQNLTPVKPGTGFFKNFTMTQASLVPSDSREYEDCLNPDILAAPICDICIVQQGDPAPEGFFRLYKTPGNKKANLNTGSGGNGIYLCIKKDLTGQIAPITNIVIVFPERGENIPPGYHFVHRGNTACNLNTGTSAERIYLCYKKDFLSNPLTDIQVIFPPKGETAPKSFQVIDRSVSGFPANLNFGTGGVDISLTYRQDLLRFGCLLNEVDAEGEKILKRRNTRVDFDQSTSNHSSYNTRDGGVGKRGSLADVIMRTRSRSKSPVPRRGRARSRSGSGSETGSGEGGLSSKNMSNPDSAKAARSLLEDTSLGESTDDLEEAFKKAIISNKDPHVIPEISKMDENQEIVETIDAMDEWPELPEELLNPKEMEQASLRKSQEVVDANGDKIALYYRKALLAILSVVYIRHGSLWDIAISGLMKLFKDTDFFEKDLAALPLPATVTMLDLTIEAVSDRFDLSPETEHNKLLEFLKIIIKHSGARLAPFSLQRIFKSVSYVCTIQATKSNWVTSGLAMPCNDPNQEITPFRVLKQLLWDTVAQVETVEIAQFLPDSDYFEASIELDQVTQDYIEIRIIVEDLIDDVIDSVEVSRISEVVMQSLSKQSLTTTTSGFWHSMNSFSRKLFADTQLKSAFVTLCALCKQAWLSVRKAKNGDWIPRDLGSKLVALEALMEFCNCANDRMKASKVMGYQIRRVVIPCLMFNTTYALCDHRIFSKLLKVITALWKNWRRHIRIEFAIICEQIVFKVLQATVIQIRPIYQMIVVQEVENWFDQPHILIEMFVNYDMDRKFVSHWNTFSYLVRSLCAIGRRLSLVTGAWDWKPGGANSHQEENNKVVVTVRDVHLQALHEVSRMAKTLMDASGHAFLIMQDLEFRNRSLGENAGWIEDEETTNKTAEEEADRAEVASNADSECSGQKKRVSSGRNRAGSIRLRRAAHQESEEMIKQAIKIYNEKDSLKKAVLYLLSKGFMPDTPQEIANFLRVYKNSFDPAAIGDFLGEGGVTPHEEEYWSQIRFRYTRAVSFVEMEIEHALRLYLTGCGFRLPGEAQKIDRFVDVFVKAFWQDNSGTQYCPFKHPDTIHLLSYAIIMLNTDLHRANLENKNKNKKMTKEEFCKNLRGCDQGSDVSKEILGSIYDSIQAQPIELSVNKKADPLPEGKNTPADDMVNSVLSQNTKNSNDIRIAEEKKFIRELGQTLRDSEDLLRSLSPFTYRFHLTNVDTKISLDLVSYMFETVWFHFHAIVEGIFNAKNTDMEVKFAALDVLCYCLTSALFLNLKVERMALATLLKSFRKECEDLPHVVNTDRPIPDDSWYDDVENATAANTMEIIAKLHHLTVHIKDTIQEATNYEITRQIAAKFEKKAKILENNLFFIRQGDLMKLSRNGKSQSYKFFLFSNHLIYAHVNMKGHYVVHEQLSLSALSVNDVDTDPNHTSFYISHPIKSFVVVAEAPSMKQQWVRDINQAIVNCKKRETMHQDGPLNRRMSMFSRIEDQQDKLVREQHSLSITTTPSANRIRRHSLKAAAIPTTDTLDSQDMDEHGFVQAIPFSAPTSPMINPGSGKKVTFPSSGEKHDISDLLLAADDSDAGSSSYPGSSNMDSGKDAVPTPQERAQRQQENISKFQSIITHSQEDLVNSLFQAVKLLFFVVPSCNQ
jgi:hypothetical protein